MIPSETKKATQTGQLLLDMAERQGFEPWDGLTRRRFSRPVLSATQPPLQKREMIPKFSRISSTWAKKNHIQATINEMNL